MGISNANKRLYTCEKLRFEVKIESPPSALPLPENPADHPEFLFDLPCSGFTDEVCYQQVGSEKKKSKICSYTWKFAAAIATEAERSSQMLPSENRPHRSMFAWSMLEYHASIMLHTEAASGKPTGSRAHTKHLASLKPRILFAGEIQMLQR